MSWINEELLRANGVDIGTGRVLSDDLVAYEIPGGAAAVQVWKAVSAEASSVGGWPLLCGKPEEFSRIEEALEQRPTLAEVIAAVPAAPPVEALKAARAERHVAVLARLKSMGIALPSASSESDSEKEALSDADWPSKPSAVERLPTTPFDILQFRQPLAACVLIIARTDDATLVPAIMNFGGFNDCPGPSLHVSFLRDWNRRYGAVPIAITGDVIELFVPRPLVDKHEAFAVAQEQYVYAPDIVDQGTQSVSRLAMELWSSPNWFFWWD